MERTGCGADWENTVLTSLPAVVVCSLGRLPSMLQLLGAETRDPDMLNIKAEGLKRVFGLLFMGRGGGKERGWVTNCLQSQ